MVPNILSVVALGSSLLGVEIQVRRVEEPSDSLSWEPVSFIRKKGRPVLSRVRAPVRDADAQVLTFDIMMM